MSHTQMLRYCDGFHAGLPVAADFMLFVSVSGSNQVSVVCTRTMPVVGLPCGSTCARQNWKPALPITPWNAGRTEARSLLFWAKSWLSSAMMALMAEVGTFSALVFHTTCTTTGMVKLPPRSGVATRGRWSATVPLKPCWARYCWVKRCAAQSR